MKSYLCERFDLREIAPQPWKNGAGITREIAVSPAGASPETFDWRISIAEVARAAPFSTFPGIDRCIVLLRGSGMLLQGADGDLVHRLDRRHEPFHFSGDLPLDATLLGGASTDFNVMTRRGRFRAEVTPYGGAARLPPGEAGLLLCSEGEWRIEGTTALELAPLQGVVWREDRPALAVRPLRPESCLLFVSFRRPGGDPLRGAKGHHLLGKLASPGRVPDLRQPGDGYECFNGTQGHLTGTETKL